MCISKWTIHEPFFTYRAKIGSSWLSFSHLGILHHNISWICCATLILINHLILGNFALDDNNSNSGCRSFYNCLNCGNYFNYIVSMLKNTWPVWTCLSERLLVHIIKRCSHLKELSSAHGVQFNKKIFKHGKAGLIYFGLILFLLIESKPFF